jgi:hypothetical protein
MTTNCPMQVLAPHPFRLAVLATISGEHIQNLVRAGRIRYEYCRAFSGDRAGLPDPVRATGRLSEVNRSSRSWLFDPSLQWRAAVIHCRSTCREEQRPNGLERSLAPAHIPVRRRIAVANTVPIGPCWNEMHVDAKGTVGQYPALLGTRCAPAPPLPASVGTGGVGDGGGVGAGKRARSGQGSTSRRTDRFRWPW